MRRPAHRQPGAPIHRPARSLLLLAPLTWLLLACTGEQSLEALEVLNYGQCAGLESGLTVISYEQLASIRGGAFVPSETETSSAEPAPTAATWNNTLLVALSLGAQPTPGYGFTLNGVSRQGSVARIEVTWRTPPADAVLAQVMTHPCLVVAMPCGDLRRVAAFDRNGTGVGSVDLP